MAEWFFIANISTLIALMHIQVETKLAKVECLRSFGQQNTDSQIPHLTENLCEEVELRSVLIFRNHLDKNNTVTPQSVKAKRIRDRAFVSGLTVQHGLQLQLSYHSFVFL